MKIIGGEFGGRLLVTPRGSGTRPSASRVREGLASALEARGRIVGARVLDLFAGSGALGFEALSRGASSLVAVDDDTGAVRSITDNARALGVAEKLRVLKLDLLARPDTAATRLSELAHDPFTLAFLDAPYADLDAVPDLLAGLTAQHVFADGAVVAVEHPAGATAAWPAAFTPIATYRYGDTGVTLLEVASTAGT